MRPLLLLLLLLLSTTARAQEHTDAVGVLEAFADVWEPVGHDRLIYAAGADTARVVRGSGGVLVWRVERTDSVHLGGVLGRYAMPRGAYDYLHGLDGDGWESLRTYLHDLPAARE